MADPFTTGLLAITAANNPAVAADALSLVGDSGMPGPFDQLCGGTSLGQFLGGQGDPSGGLVPQAGGVAGGFGGGQIPGALLQGFGGPSMLGGPQGVPGQQQQGLGALQGFKGPEAVKPELAGGIRGAQGVPQVQPPSVDPIMQLLQGLLGGQGGPPDLGSLLGRR